MKKFLGLYFYVAFAGILSLNAQQREATISFKEEAFDFGTIKAADGSVSHVFDFTNTGSTPLIIQNVETSCGCTTPEWTKQPVLPGAKGFIKVSFNPEGRSGQIDKTITIKSNASKPAVYLKITGSIIPKALPVQDEFRFTMGDLRFKQSQINFSTIPPYANKTEKVEVINSGQTPTKISFVNVPAFLTVKSQPEVLQPNQKGVVIISYDAAKKNDWDFLIDYLFFSINGKQDPNYKLTITATIVEDYSKLTPQQLANAPKILFENTAYDFGSIKQGQKAEHEFKFKNEGKTNLKLRKISTSCGCTTTNPKDKEIKPGESSSITATFNSTGKVGMQNKVITIISNDPKKPSTTLLIKGMVEDQSTKTP
jgi:hypothetical protein